MCAFILIVHIRPRLCVPIFRYTFAFPVANCQLENLLGVLTFSWSYIAQDTRSNRSTVCNSKWKALSLYQTILRKIYCGTRSALLLSPYRVQSFNGYRRQIDRDCGASNKLLRQSFYDHNTGLPCLSILRLDKALSNV